MSFREQIADFISKELSPAALGRKVYDVAATEAAILARNMNYPGQPELTVNTPTEVDYVYHWLPDAAKFALNKLIALSPVMTGKFQSSFFFVVDGEFHPPSSLGDGIPGNPREIIIGNLEPYNRKIEVQTGSGRPLHFSTPPGMYESAAEHTMTAYSNLVTAEVLDDYREFSGRYVDVRSRKVEFQTPALRLTVITP